MGGLWWRCADAVWKLLGVVSVVSCLGGGVTQYREAHAAQVALRGRHAWLHGQCQDAAFQAQMQRHDAALCAAAAEAFAVPPWAAGLRGCVPPWVGAGLAWAWAWLWPAGCVAALALPTLALPAYRARTDDWEHEMLAAGGGRSALLPLTVPRRRRVARED